MKLYLDANVIIFGHEADDELRQLVLERIWEWSSHPDGEFATSIFSRLECRVVPLRNRDSKLLSEYEEFFSGDVVEIVEISLPIIDLAASLRAAHGFKSPDALHLATAIHVGAQRFFTADVRLQKCREIEVEVLKIPQSHNPSSSQ